MTLSLSRMALSAASITARQARVKGALTRQMKPISRYGFGS